MQVKFIKLELWSPMSVELLKVDNSTCALSGNDNCRVLLNLKAVSFSSFARQYDLPVVTFKLN